MKFSKKDIDHVSKLANLPLTDAEVSAMEKDLSKILDYVHHIQDADISSIDATSYIQNLSNVVREDTAGSFDDREALLNTVPQREGEYVKVKAVLKRP